MEERFPREAIRLPALPDVLGCHILGADSSTPFLPVGKTLW